jgi:hypothetical protein
MLVTLNGVLKIADFGVAEVSGLEKKSRQHHLTLRIAGIFLV